MTTITLFGCALFTFHKLIGKGAIITFEQKGELKGYATNSDFVGVSERDEKNPKNDKPRQ